MATKLYAAYFSAAVIATWKWTAPDLAIVERSGSEARQNSRSTGLT